MDRFQGRPSIMLRVNRKICYLLLILVVLIVVVPFSQPTHLHNSLSSLRENWSSGKVFPSTSSSTPRPGRVGTPYRGHGGPLSAFLHEHGIQNDRTLFVTMANKAYVDPMVNFKWGLDIFHLGSDYLVLCLDQACLEQAAQYDILAYDGFIEEGVNWHQQIARMKFEANLDLLDGGYNFVLLDGDVYLTGRRHPLSGMRPLSDPSWSIQFQSDSHSDQSSSINIGWYWARPSPLAYELFNRSYTRWTSTHEWDQAIMNSIRWEMIQEGKLDYPASIVLPLRDYKMTMLFDWQPFWTNFTMMEGLMDEGVVIHYTWVWDIRKQFVAKHFPTWYNATYYSNSPPILSTSNIRGTSAEIFQKLVRAANMARMCGRHFMFPFLLNQTLTPDSHSSHFVPPTTAIPPPEPGTRWRMVPPHWICEVGDLMRIGDWVEGTYLRNRERYNTTELSVENHSAPESGDLTDNWEWEPTYQACLRSDAEIFNIDFGNGRENDYQNFDDPVHEVIHDSHGSSDPSHDFSHDPSHDSYEDAHQGAHETLHNPIHESTHDATLDTDRESTHSAPHDTTNHGSNHGSIPEPGHDASHDISHGSTHDTTQSPPNQGSTHDTTHSSDHGSVQESSHHAIHNTPQDAPHGSTHDTTHGPPHDSTHNAISDTPRGSTNDPTRGSTHESIQEPNHDTTHGSSHDTHVAPHGSIHVSHGSIGEQHESPDN